MKNIRILNRNTDLRNLYNGGITIMFKRFDSEERRKERAKKHNCSGICYAPTYMCPSAEWCDETRVGEFIATIISAVIFILILLSPFILIGAAILYFIFH